MRGEMVKMLHSCPVVAALLFLVACKPAGQKQVSELTDTIPLIQPQEKPVDTLLTAETRALWLNLKKLRGTGILFGQQDATVSGIDGRTGPEHSDVKAVTGTHPALYGWEIARGGNNANIDSIPFSDIRRGMIGAFERGGINTVTWHLNNPVSRGSAWDVYPAVQQILPDSSRAGDYQSELVRLAAFFNQLRTSDGRSVPLIFRPFHENNGNWFWWGKGQCTPEEYITLWRFTVTYLRDSLHVHNLLYTYSTDMFETQQEYLERYPGDEWVDILGTENYWDFQTGASVSNGVAQLRILAGLAAERMKLAALTECGFEGIPVKNWWTQFLLNPVRNDSVARNITYIMVWRNVNRKHYYTPYPGHKNAPDFIAFEQDTFTIFEKDLTGIYK